MSLEHLVERQRVRKRAEAPGRGLFRRVIGTTCKVLPAAKVGTVRATREIMIDYNQKNEVNICAAILI